MDYETMRFECLKTLIARGMQPEIAIEEARKMMEFIKEPSLYEKAYGKIETPKATIHREPPFSDYKPE